MKRVSSATIALVLLPMLNACGGADGATPTGPTTTPVRTTGPTPGVPPGPPPEERPQSSATGDIRIVALSHDPDGRLAVRDCVSGNAVRTCTDDWSGMFEVSVDRDMVWAVLTVSFYDGPTRCGYAAATVPSLPAGFIATFRPSRIFLSDEYGTFASPCPLPARTTRMVAVLWTDDDWSTSLTRQFEDTYTFVRP
jgi:hypothetical protein